MSDVHSPEVRSKNMRAIRSANTQPEMIIRKALHATGLRYRLGGAGLPGRPDLVFPLYRSVIFVNGCFWHGHDCKYFKLPQTRREFWSAKIGTNRERDQISEANLHKLGWNVIVIWECSIRRAKVNIGELVRVVRRQLELNISPPQTHDLTAPQTISL